MIGDWCNLLIYSIIIVDGDSGVLLLEKPMKALDKDHKISPELLAGFFKALNSMIDDIQISMKKGRDVSNMTRAVTSEGSSIILHYQPQARVLLCSISDPDDDENKIREILRDLGKRFWQKHRGDLELFRKEGVKNIFNSFSVDLDTYSLEGKVAESFPKTMITKMALERVKTMGVIDENQYRIALLCDGKNSALKIARELDISRDMVNIYLKKLEDVDIIKFKGR